MNISVSIVEDDTLVQDCLVKLIHGSSGCRCVSWHSTAEDALKEIPNVRPDVTLMDINLPGMNGVECVRQLKPQLPDTEFIMLTAYQNTEHIFKALAAGATGYMLKQTPQADLLDGIREVHAGGSPMSSYIARRIVQSFRQAAVVSEQMQRLSPREAEVLELLAKGFLYKEIAGNLNLGYATIHTHIRHIYKKLQAGSRTEAVAKYFSKKKSPNHPKIMATA